MNRKKTLISILAIGLCIMIMGCSSDNNSELPYNNEQSYQELITHRYTSSEFDDILEVMHSWKWTDTYLYELVDLEDIECARNIENNRYVVLLSEDDERLLISFEEDYHVTNCYYIADEFLSQEDFDDVQSGITNMDEILEMDKNPIWSGWSSVSIMASIVEEGIVIITYDNVLTAMLSGEAETTEAEGAGFIVNDIEFHSNEEILEMLEKENSGEASDLSEMTLAEYFVRIAPYFLPIDKM